MVCPVCPVEKIRFKYKVFISNSMKKGLKITLIVLGVIVLLTVIAGSFIYFKCLSTSTDKAILNIKEGDVEVNTGNGWVKATDGMKLSLRDSVKTLGNGMALIVLYESVMVTLEPNTEVSIKSLSEKNLVVSQNSGSTWNKFSDLAGVKTYNVETPTTVATVRGTGFNVVVSNGDSEIDVGEGVVDVSSDGDKLEIRENMAAIKKKGQKMVEEKMSPEKRMKIMKNMIQDMDNMKDLRRREIMKHKDMIEQLRVQYKFTDEQMYSYLDKIDSGEINDEELIAKAPVKLPALQKIKKMNDNIKKQRVIIEKINVQLDGFSPADLANLKVQRDELRQQIGQKIQTSVLNAQQNIADKTIDIKEGVTTAKEGVTAAVINANYKPNESGEKTITDAAQQKEEEINKSTAVAAVAK